MKFDIQKRESGLYYVIYEHQANKFDFKIINGTLEEKLKFVDEFLQTTHAKFKNYTQKEVLLAFAKSDKEVAEYYRQLYPRGGSRKNAGRKQGSVQKAPKSDRTERFTKAINKEESEYLEFCLEWYRSLKKENPELLKNILYQVKHSKIKNWLPVGVTGGIREIK